MLDRATRAFHSRVQGPKNHGFFKLKYPEKLTDSTFNRFHASQAQDQNCIAPIDSPVRITLPFKDQESANFVHRELRNLCLRKLCL